MAGNPVLGFLSVQPTGDGPHATVTKMLRFLGIAVLIGVAFNIVGAILQLTMGTAYLDTGAAAASAAGTIMSLVFGLLVAAAICFWITFAITAWNNGEARANTHVLVIAILATVFGAIGVLGALVGGFLIGAALYGTGVSVLASVIAVLGLLVSGFELYCGVMILTNRSKATAGNTAPPGMTN